MVLYAFFMYVIQMRKAILSEAEQSELDPDCLVGNFLTPKVQQQNYVIITVLNHVFMSVFELVVEFVFFGFSFFFEIGFTVPPSHTPPGGGYPSRAGGWGFRV